MGHEPDAPAEVRGKFSPIATKVPGIQICEHFPLMARMMDKVALVRSLHYHTGATHENGQRWMMTGHDFQPDAMKPHVGSVISRVFGQQGDLPANVILPEPIGNTGAGPLHGQTAAYLGSAHEPFFLQADPAAPDFKVGDLEAPKVSTASGSTPARSCSTSSTRSSAAPKRGRRRCTTAPTSVPSAC